MVTLYLLSTVCGAVADMDTRVAGNQDLDTTQALVTDRSYPSRLHNPRQRQLTTHSE